MNNIQVLIVEDEVDSQTLLQIILNDYCPQIDIVGIAANKEEAKKLLEANSIDLVFLDIHLGNHTSFDFLNETSNRNFKIIFTTAHEEYALKAFKYEAIDYVLKPYSPTEIVSAVKRVEEKLVDKSMLSRLDQLTSDLSKPRQNKLSVTSSEGISIYEVETIIRVEGQGSYSQMYFTGGEKNMICKSLKEIESILPNHFFRTHNSHIINLDHVIQFKKQDGGSVLLSGNYEVPVSRRKKQEFLTAIKFLSI